MLLHILVQSIGSLIAKESIASSNTFGENLFFLKEKIKIRTMPTGQKPLTIDDHFMALSRGLAKDKNDEITIRMYIWWAYNDRIINGEAIHIDQQQKAHWKENLETFKDLQD